ncbi:hypothetical protein GIY56_02025 [Paracoccus sp. YIM 132242]|uniref:Uncharacterized protein n=1 Tax=Paracoccus lichenicola TaxID=2665644 RepID=A0A6L6HLE5_9RHOB|nr:hypothetical protein [Paracoccus lichenicola]MTD99060.1 hypothetical protein [Paracoccus lichenicola]
MNKMCVFLMLLVAGAPLTVSAQSGKLYADMIRQSDIDHQIDCAATILALGGDDELASLVAVDFVTRAAPTIDAKHDRHDIALSTQIAMDLAIARSTVLRMGFGLEDHKQAAIKRQAECVLSRLDEGN